MSVTFKHYLSAALVLIAITSANATAGSPEKVAGTARVTAEELIALAAEYPDLILIDSRVTANRKHGYIEGSLSLPDTETTCDSLKELLATPQTPAAFYCNGVKCGRSARAIKVAVDCGYRNLYWFRGGFEEWKSKNFPYLHQE